MHGISIRFGTATALAFFIVAADAPAPGENVPLHMVPKPVLDAVRVRFTNARIARAEKDREDRGFVYEITIRHQGRNIDIVLTPEGRILLIKKEIAAADLPGPVGKTLGDTYPNATYQVVEAVIKVQGSQEKLAYYEVDLATAQRRLVEVRLSPDGKILKGER